MPLKSSERVANNCLFRASKRPPTSTVYVVYGCPLDSKNHATSNHKVLHGNQACNLFYCMYIHIWLYLDKQVILTYTHIGDHQIRSTLYMVRFPTVSQYFELGFWVRFQMNIQCCHFLKMNYRIKKFDAKMPNWAEISSLM